MNFGEKDLTPDLLVPDERGKFHIPTGEIDNFLNPKPKGAKALLLSSLKTLNWLLDRTWRKLRRKPEPQPSELELLCDKIEAVVKENRAKGNFILEGIGDGSEPPKELDEQFGPPIVVGIDHESDIPAEAIKSPPPATKEQKIEQLWLTHGMEVEMRADEARLRSLVNRLGYGALPPEEAELLASLSAKYPTMARAMLLEDRILGKNQKGIEVDAAELTEFFRQNGITLGPGFFDNPVPDAALSEAESKAKYDELLFAVARRFPGESRHETALRYIREAERFAKDPEKGFV
jgi:hypothetical protein